MKKILLMVLVLVSSVAYADKLVESLLRRIIVKEIVKHNPKAEPTLSAITGVYGNCKSDTYHTYPQQIPCPRQPVYSPENASELIQYGKSLGNQNRWQEALSCFIRALQLEPENVDAHYYAGIVYLKLGNQKAAINEYLIIEQIQTATNHKMKRLLNQINNF